ncbi:hypothetical protein [Campylobacter avium]|uniref:hypothetical protein n=1 Tax=Campylobacter avium TaxID=522485 RepID=UPI00248A9264|nr:hypothetical protein [Campylobacter avium]
MNFLDFLEYLPLILVGFFMGLFKALRAEVLREDEEDESVTSKFDVLKIFIVEGIQGAVFCFVVYGLLSLTELPYIFKVCVGALIAYLGVDKAMELVEKVLSIRKK